MRVRSLLGRVNDSQSAAEARHFADQVAARRSEDEGSISEYLTCGHVDHVDVLQAALDASVRARTERKLRILCDVDGVLADFVGLVLDYVQRNTGLSYLHSAVDEWDMFKCLGLEEHWPHFRKQCDELALCRTMRQLPGARAFYTELERLSAGEVKVCTTPMTCGWLTQRAEWLVAFGVPLKNQIQAFEKHELAGAWDVLIDDKAENCEAFMRAGGVAFCIATPYNTHCSSAVKRGTHEECLAWLRAL